MYSTIFVQHTDYIYVDIIEISLLLSLSQLHKVFISVFCCDYIIYVKFYNVLHSICNFHICSIHFINK